MTRTAAQWAHVVQARRPIASRQAHDDDDRDDDHSPCDPRRQVAHIPVELTRLNWSDFPSLRLKPPMAAMAAQNQASQAPSEKLGVPSKNPLPLSASQEAQVREIFYQRVRKQCGPEIKGKFSVLDRVSKQFTSEVTPPS